MGRQENIAGAFEQDDLGTGVLVDSVDAVDDGGRRQHGYDVVLVDDAGECQETEPLNTVRSGEFGLAEGHHLFDRVSVLDHMDREQGGDCTTKRMPGDV